jgi:hypothetical protein
MKADPSDGSSRNTPQRPLIEKFEFIGRRTVPFNGVNHGFPRNFSSNGRYGWRHGYAGKIES